MATYHEADLRIVDLGRRGLRLGEKLRGLVVIEALQHQRRIREEQAYPGVVIAGVERELSPLCERRSGVGVVHGSIIGGADETDARRQPQGRSFTRIAD